MDDRELNSMLQKILLYVWLIIALAGVLVLALFYPKLETRTVILLMISISISVAMYQFRKQQLNDNNKSRK
ncbi:MAG: hypothetical protein NZ108_00265 [Bacteroidia bacterium]|nr:hypothetical protein [Bacteroidia bacterium]